LRVTSRGLGDVYKRQGLIRISKKKKEISFTRTK
jgi:hypothetical protein